MGSIGHRVLLPAPEKNDRSKPVVFSMKEIPSGVRGFILFHRERKRRLLSTITGV